MAWVCSCSLGGIAGSNFAAGHGCLSLVSAVSCQLEVSAMDPSLVQRSPTVCGVSECELVALDMRPRPNRAAEAWKKMLRT